jgi:hypothetical protein
MHPRARPDLLRTLAWPCTAAPHTTTKQAGSRVSERACLLREVASLSVRRIANFVRRTANPGWSWREACPGPKQQSFRSSEHSEGAGRMRA